MDTQVVRRPDGPQAWEDHRAIVIDLYIKRGLELEQVMDIMEKEHFFKATEKQYKSHFTAWGIRKNVRSNEWDAILRKKRKREQEGKQSAFRLRGTPVDSSRIAREEKRRKPGEKSKMAEAVTPPDLICSTPSPVARSPISSPLPLSAPSFISIHSIIQRVLDDLDIFKPPNIALERNDMMESFRGLNIDTASFLSHEERGILTDAIKWRIQRLNFRDPVWVELMSEIHEALWVPRKPSKRDNGSEVDERLATLILNDGVEVLHGGLFGLRSLFRKIMDCCKPSKHLLRTHVGSKEIPSMLWGMLTYIDNMQTRLNSELCAAQLALYLIHLLLLRTYAATEKRYRNTEDSEIDLLKLYLGVKFIIALLTTKSTKILLEREFKDAHCGFCSPAPPSPGSGRSQISFVSDSVVDWKELVRGRSPHDSTQGNAEAWIDRLETLE